MFIRFMCKTQVLLPFILIDMSCIPFFYKIHINLRYLYRYVLFVYLILKNKNFITLSGCPNIVFTETCQGVLRGNYRFRSVVKNFFLLQSFTMCTMMTNVSNQFYCQMKLSSFWISFIWFVELLVNIFLVTCNKTSKLFIFSHKCFIKRQF